MKKVLKIFLCLILVCIVFILINIFLNQNIFITKYQINNEKIPNSFEGYKIIQLTDVHSIRDEKQKNKIVSKIKKEDPDCIFITGDLIDAGYYSEQNDKYITEEIDFPDLLTFEFVSELVDIAQVYFVYGNHEMMLLDDPENNVFKVALEEVGVKILNNKIDTITIGEDTIKLIGVQDPATLYKDKKYAYVGENNYDKVKQILDDLFESEEEIENSEPEEAFTILLSHRPEYFKMYTEYPIDLALTGHTHGGVIILPFIGGLYAHPQGWFPEYTAGMYKTESFQMIIGRGIGYSQVPIRVFNPPEIVEIILK